MKGSAPDNGGGGVEMADDLEHPRSVATRAREWALKQLRLGRGDEGGTDHKGRSDIPDLIEMLGLREWYTQLSETDKQMLYDNSWSYGLGVGGVFNKLDQPFVFTPQDQQSYLGGVGSQAVRNREFEFAEMVLLKALDAEGDTPTGRHFVYDTLIDLYYKLRHKRHDATEMCVKYCEEDIDIVDVFLREWRKETQTTKPPRIPSFMRLAIIYEKQENYQEALKICDMAIQRGLSDGTKGGFEGRKQRIQNKMDG